MKARHKASLLTATRKLENIFRRWAGLDAGCWWFISLLWSSWVLSTEHHLFFEISTRLLPDGLPLTLGAVLMCTDLRWFHEKWIGDLEKGLIRKMGLKQSRFLPFLFYIKTEVSMYYLECFWVNFVAIAILINITRVTYVPLTNWTQRNIFRFHILIDLRVILTVKWNFPFSTTCILMNLILDFPQLLSNL